MSPDRANVERPEAYYVAAPGEVNDVVVAHVDAHTITVRDPGATIEASGGCTSVDAHNARCVSSGPPLTVARVETGDMNDRIRSFGNAPPVLDPELIGNGGPGDDELVGGESADSLDGGGGGHDRMLGAAGADILLDGDRPGEFDADVLVGGPEVDTLVYEPRDKPVTVDLREAKTPEGDKIATIENVSGGNGADVLTGDGYANMLRGGLGSDRLRGGAGDDLLNGENGFDTSFCGRGTDVAWVDTRRDYVASDCETVFVPGVAFAFSARPYPVAGTRFSLGCPRFRSKARRGPCSGKLVLRETRGRTRLLGSGTISKRSGQRGRPVRVKLTPAGRRLARGKGGVLAIVTLKGKRLPSIGWTIRLRR